MGLVVFLLAAACGDTPTPAAAAQESCTPDGSLSVAIYGEISGKLAWRGGDLRCSGMPRPHGAGARLHFAGTLEDQGAQRDLAFIIGLPELEPGETVQETPARITLMEENNGRFFSTATADICWSDVQVHRNPGDGIDYHAVSGRAYCVAPLAEVNGSGGVTLSELEFSGRIDWGGQQ